MHRWIDPYIGIVAAVTNVQSGRHGEYIHNGECMPEIPKADYNNMEVRNSGVRNRGSGQG